MPPKVSFLKLTQPAAVKRLYERHHVMQDFLVPLKGLEQTLKVVDRELQVLYSNYFLRQMHLKSKHILSTVVPSVALPVSSATFTWYGAPCEKS